MAVEKYHNEQRELEHQLADPAIYEASEKNHLKRILDRKVQVDKLLDEAESAWMEAEEAIENAE